MEYTTEQKQKGAKIGTISLIVVDVFLSLICAFYMMWTGKYGGTPFLLLVFMIFIYGQAVARVLFRAVGGGKRGLLTQASALCLVLTALGILNFPLTRLAAHIPSIILIVEYMGIPLSLILLVAASQSQMNLKAPTSEQGGSSPRGSIHMNLKTFNILILSSLLSSIIVDVIVIITMISRQIWWGLDLVLVYMTSSLVMQIIALREGKFAIAGSDSDRLWRAGLLAIVGGLQHFVLIGVPSVIGGFLAVRCAHQVDELK